MVEIDYYSKYLKYKQKYLKQKNLQIGGENIRIKIVVKTINSTPPPNFIVNNYDNVEIDDSKSLKDILDLFLKQNSINMESYAVHKLKKENPTDDNKTLTQLDLTKSFKDYKVENNDIIIISEKKKIKINIVVKKIDKQKSEDYDKLQNIPFNNTDNLLVIFKKLIEMKYLTGPFVGFNFKDFEIYTGNHFFDLKKNFLENGISDNQTITIREKPKSQ